MKHTKPFITVTCLIYLTSCGTTIITDQTDRESPVFRKKNETRIVVGTDTGTVALDDLAKIAKTVRVYKKLNASDKEIIKQVVQLKFDGLVAQEMQRLKPAYESKKVEIRKSTVVRIEKIRKSGTAAKKPAQVIEKQIATAKADEARETLKIDLEWKSVASTAVTKKYGSDFAVPVKNNENKAVVAFASIKESSISVSSASYETNQTSTQLAKVANQQQKISHSGQNYALLDTPVTIR